MASSTIRLAGAFLLTFLPMTALAQPSAQPAQQPVYTPQPAPQPAPAQPVYTPRPAPAQPAPAQPVYTPQPAPAQPVYAPQPAQPAQPAPPMVQGPGQQEPQTAGDRFKRLLQRFTFGFQVVPGGTLANDQTSAAAESLSGWGVFARVRINPRWSAELETPKLSVPLGNFTRELRPFNLSGVAHLFEFYGVEGYGRAGIGTGAEFLKNNNTGVNDPRDRTNLHLHVGAGALYRVWNNIGVGGEVRLLRTSQSEPDEVITTGLHFGLNVSYHF